MLFVPGHLEEMMKKGAGTAADCIVLDLEDAVPSCDKLIARKKVRHALEEGVYLRKTVFVRVNSFETDLTIGDIEGVACRNLHGFVYPRADRAEDIKRLDSQLERIEKNLDLPAGHFSLIAVIETPLAVLNARNTAEASPRIVGLIFGCEDFLAELQGRHSADEIALVTPRAQVAMAARAAGIEPIDTPYVKVSDIEGLRSFAEMSLNLGMAGMCALTPQQAAVINEIYTPKEEEIQYARKVLQAAEEIEGSDRGVFIAGDKFISPPTIKAARKTLARYEAIRSLEIFCERS